MYFTDAKQCIYGFAIDVERVLEVFQCPLAFRQVGKQISKVYARSEVVLVIGQALLEIK